MLRRNIHPPDLARSARTDYMSRMSHAHSLHYPVAAPGDSCCAGHRVPADETLRAAEAKCRSEGLRLTPQRRAVFQALAEAKRPLGAYDLIEILRRDGGRPPAPIAIYRALDFLKDNGFIHRLETLNAFIACPHLHHTGERIVFLICETCRHVEEAIAAPLNEALAAIAAERGFFAARQVVELAGTCRSCRSPER
jgi:Fur family zinc uptake transcriptional regulator